MASQVAPGYNPEASLLQGGNAPIVPVQGGGGMEAGAGLPPDYNPSNSLLNVGASAPIVPVKGGGQEGGDGNTAYEGYVIERYEPTLTSVSVPTLTPEVRKGTMIPLIQLYKKATEPKLLELKSFLRDPVPFVPEDEDSPLYKICPTPGGVRSVRPKFFQRVRRRIVTITYDDPKICLLPNINGEVSKFLQYMKLFSDAEGVLKPGYFVLLTGSFFSENKDENAMLYIEFLKAKQKNPETLYQLIELTPEFVAAACDLYKVVYSESYLESPEGKNRPLVPFLEPNIVIFRNQHLVFKTAELPIQRDDPTVKVSDMLTKTPPEKYASIVITPKIGAVDEVPGNAGDAPAEKKYFRFDLSPNLYKFFKFPATSSIVCPAGKTCQNFKGGYKLDDKLTDDLKLPESGIYVIYKNTDSMPLLKEEGATLSDEERAALTAKPPEVPREVKPGAPPKKEEPAKPGKLEERAFEELAEPEVPISLNEKFQANPLAVKVPEERTIEVNSFKFFIRYPLEEEVAKDWREGKFTQSEVDFFNMLELTPTLVNKAFGKKEANQKLAEFLQSIVLSNCFEDVSLLSKSECSNTHAFIKQIYYTKLRFLLESMYDELGVLKPLSFLDMIALLKRLLKDKPLEPIRISKKNFRGNLFKPLHKIVFDPSTGFYSIDFSDIPEDILAEVKFFRRKSANYDALLRSMFSMIEEYEDDVVENENEADDGDDGDDNNNNAPPKPGFLNRVRALLRRPPPPPPEEGSEVEGAAVREVAEAAEDLRNAVADVRAGRMERTGRILRELGESISGLGSYIHTIRRREAPAAEVSANDAALREVEEEINALEEEVAELRVKKPSVLNRLRSGFTRSRSEFGESILSLKKAIAPPASSKFKEFFSRSAAPSSASTGFRFQLTRPRSEFREAVGTLKKAIHSPAPSRFSGLFTLPSAKAESLYTLADLRSFNPTPDFFNVIDTEPDGLCFYRAVLKGLQTSPKSNRKTFPVSYNPTKEESLAFIKQVREKLIEQRATLMIGGVSVEDFFNGFYAPQEGEEKVLEPRKNGPPFTQAEKEGRIEYRGKLVKMTFQEYLDLMNSDDPNEIPYADSEAGVGDAAARRKDVIIVVYRKLANGSFATSSKAFYIPPTITDQSKFPLSKVVFLENTGGNHFNLLKLKSGKKVPHNLSGSVGGGEEIFDLGEPQNGGGSEIFDLGEPVKRGVTRRNKKRNHK